MKNSLNLVVVIALLVVLGCSCPAKLKELSAKKEAPQSTPASAATPGDSDNSPSSSGSNGGGYDLTIDQFKQIRIGMSRTDVERLLGGKGEEISSSTGGGMRFTVNKWEGESYRSIILTFKNDKVMTTSQVGLK